MEPESSLPYSQEPAICPYPEPSQSSPYPKPHFLKIHLNIILPTTPGFPKWSSFLQVSPPKPCTRLPSPPFALHAPPISFFPILSPEQYLDSATDRIINTTLLPPPPATSRRYYAMSTCLSVTPVRRIHPWPTKATNQPSRETCSLTLHRSWDDKGHRHTASYHTWRHKKLTISCSGTHRSNCDPLINSMVITQLICATHC
jgi:hypothetical protein